MLNRAKRNCSVSLSDTYLIKTEFLDIVNIKKGLNLQFIQAYNFETILKVLWKNES